MKTYEMTDELFDYIVKDLLDAVLIWAHGLSGIQPGLKIKPTPVSDGEREYPYPLAMRLKKLWDYAKGTGEMPEDLPKIMHDLFRLIWRPVWVTGYAIPAAFWNEPLGRMCRMAQVRYEIDNGKAVSADELALIADVTGQRIRQLCAEGKIQAEKIQRKENSQTEWAIPAGEAKRFLNLRFTNPGF